MHSRHVLATVSMYSRNTRDETAPEASKAKERIIGTVARMVMISYYEQREWSEKYTATSENGKCNLKVGKS